MTVILYCPKTRSLSGDTMLTSEGAYITSTQTAKLRIIHHEEMKNKAIRNGGGNVIIGVSGYAHLFGNTIDAITNETVNVLAKGEDKTLALILTPVALYRAFFEDGCAFYEEVGGYEPLAIGSGYSMTLAAYYACGDAYKAIDATSRVSLFVGGEFHQAYLESQLVVVREFTKH